MPAIIECDPEILGGKPVVKGTRVPVDLVFELLGCGTSVEDILDDYPSLTRSIVEALLEIGKSATKYLGTSDLAEDAVGS